MNICAICGKPAECEHHLIFGVGKRNLAEEDDLTIMMCNSCHNMANWNTERIHGNSMAENLSKMLGQAIWEREWIASLLDGDNAKEYARDAFMQRYGRSYL